MKAVVFGAGKIARGFIGQLLKLSNYETTFIDASTQLVAALNESKTYHVYVLGDASKDTEVDNFEAVHINDLKKISDTLDQADVAFVSVGGNNLESVGYTIASIFNEYGIPKRAFSFVTCENVNQAAYKLESAIISKLDEELKGVFSEYIGVTEAVVMRTATMSTKELELLEPLSVWVQDFWELPANKDRYKGPELGICHLEFIENFGNYLTQKMYTNNTSNALIAYNGYLLKHDILSDAANSKEIAEMLDVAYEEINSILIAELGVSLENQRAFSKRARDKYTDVVIVDKVIRHGKDPIRKLGPQERLIAPARMALNNGITPHMIVDTIAKALFFDEPTDEAAVRLKTMRQEHGIEYVLKTVCCLDESEPLYSLVMSQVAKIREEGWTQGHE